MEAVYYRISSMELGIYSTGSRSSNYICYCIVYDNNNNQINGHFLNDRFTGKWRKCHSLMNKWRKECIKNKLTEKPFTYGVF